MQSRCSRRRYTFAVVKCRSIIHRDHMENRIENAGCRQQRFFLRISILRIRFLKKLSGQSEFEFVFRFSLRRLLSVGNFHLRHGSCQSICWCVSWWKFYDLTFASLYLRPSRSIPEPDKALRKQFCLLMRTTLHKLPKKGCQIEPFWPATMLTHTFAL